MQEENTRADIPPCIKRFSHSDMKVFYCRGANNMSRSRATLQIDRCMRGAGKDNGGTCGTRAPAGVLCICHRLERHVC